MSEQRKFKCTLEALLTVADAVCGAAERHGELGSRLPKDIVATTRGLAASVRKRKMAQDVAFTGIESLTQEQNAKLKVVEELLGQVRESAKKAFRGDQVKLRKQFYIGGERRYDLGSTIEEARSIQANCALDENQTALSTQGWLPSDTERLGTAVSDLDSTDDVQESAKMAKVDTTGELVRLANQLYDSVLAIQNAANIQWPASDSANAGTRGDFRLGSFPGYATSAAKEKVDTTTESAPHEVQPVQPTAPPPAASA